MIEEKNHLDACLLLRQYLNVNPKDTKALLLLINTYKEIDDASSEAKYIERLIKLEFSQSNIQKVMLIKELHY